MIDLRTPKHLVLLGFPLQTGAYSYETTAFATAVFEELLTRWEKQDEFLTKHLAKLSFVGVAEQSGVLTNFSKRFQKANVVSIPPKAPNNSFFSLVLQQTIWKSRLATYLKTSVIPTILLSPTDYLSIPDAATYTAIFVPEIAEKRLAPEQKSGVSSILSLITQQTSKKSLTTADCLYTCSHDSAQAIQKNYGAEKIPTVLQLGNKYANADTTALLRQPAPIRDPYFMYIGTYTQKDNMAGLMSGFATFIRSYEDTNHTKIVFAGGNGYKKILISLAKKEGILENLLLLEQLSAEEQASYLVHSLGLLRLPTEAASGLPETEALALGVPVISAELPAIREMTQEFAILLPPHHPETAAPLVYKLAKKKVSLEHSITAATHARQLTWQHTTDTLLTHLIEYCEEHKPKNLIND